MPQLTHRTVKIGMIYNLSMRKVVLIAHNLRSAHNVGSVLRTADGLGVTQVILTGYTPYPQTSNDVRLPHEVRKVHQQIHKTALGAEDSVKWHHQPDVLLAITTLKDQGYRIYALEQAPDAQLLPNFKPPQKIALVVGREVEGLEPEVIAACDGSLEIPMLGKKESFNVAQASAMALYHITFYTKP